MASFQTSSPTSLYAKVPSTPHAVEPTKIPRIKVMDDRMLNILVQMKNLLKFTNTRRALSQSLRPHVGNVAGGNHPMLQTQIDVPNLTTKKCNEAMDAVAEDSGASLVGDAATMATSSSRSLTLRRYNESSLRIGTSVFMWKPTSSSPSGT